MDAVDALDVEDVEDEEKELDFDFLLLQTLRLHFYSGSNDALTSYIPCILAKWKH